MNTSDLRIVIVGGGRVGLLTAQRLDDRGHHITLIEKNHARCREIADEYVATVIEGDATRPSILQQANLMRTDVIAGLTPYQGTNLSVCLLAKRHGAPIRTVLRREENHDDEYKDLVDAVILPEAAGARMVANAIEPGVQTLEDTVGELQVLILEVTNAAPAAGRTLSELALPRGSLIVSGTDCHGVAEADTTVESGCRYMIATEPAVEDEIIRLFRG